MGQDFQRRGFQVNYEAHLVPRQRRVRAGAAREPGADGESAARGVTA